MRFHEGCVRHKHFVRGIHFARSFCANVLEECISEHEVFISDHIITELMRHLRGKAKLMDDEAEMILASLAQGMVKVEPVVVRPEACRDPNDLPILGTARAAEAEVLVTGDKDLLVLGAYR